MKRHNLHHLLLPLIIILLLISTFQTSANPNEKNHYRFRTLSSKGGFYYDGVKAIQQDKDGFIWILMDNDIQRFDGYEYKHYYNIFKNTDNSKKWDFHGLHTNIDGILHVSTSNGVYRYNDITDSFDCIIKENLPNMYINKSNAI